MGDGSDVDGLAVYLERTGQNTGPDVEFLVDIFQVGDDDFGAVGVGHLEADTS